MQQRILYGLIPLLLALPASAQIPAKFENLKHFPADISRDSLVWKMRTITTSLGVRCQYCHVGGDTVTLQGMNFASDEKLSKRKARQMLKLVDQVNGTLLAALEQRVEPSASVTCTTCHRGLPVPRTLAEVLDETLARQGVPAAIQQYRDLRENSMQRGRYDFGEASLNELGRNLSVRGNPDHAIAIYELNAEFFPRSAQVLQALGDLYRLKGNLPVALTWYEKLLILQPNNAALKRLVGELKTRD